MIKTRAKTLAKMVGYPKVFYKKDTSGIKRVHTDIDFATGQYTITKFNFK